MGLIQETIERKIQNNLEPIHLDVINESQNHNVPKGAESHFKLLVVSEKFESQTRVERQRTVNNILKEELSGSVHALTQRLLTPTEWEKGQASSFKSPDCAHKNKVSQSKASVD